MRILLVGITLVAATVEAADLAVVAGINGAPTRLHDGATVAVRRGDGVTASDIVVTDAHSKIKLLLADDSVLTVGPNSQLRVDQVLMSGTTHIGRLGVLAGQFKLALATFLGGAVDYEVRTPTAVAGVRGTVVWGDTVRDAICALDGHVEVRPLAAPAGATLNAGDCVSQMSAGRLEPLHPSASELQAYLRDVTLE